MSTTSLLWGTPESGNPAVLAAGNGELEVARRHIPAEADFYHNLGGGTSYGFGRGGS